MTYQNRPQGNRQSRRTEIAPIDHDRMVAEITANWRYPVRGNTRDPKIIVVCDAPPLDAARQSLPMELDLHRMWAQMAGRHGFEEKDFLFLGLCPPLPMALGSSKAKHWEYILPYVKDVREIINNLNPALVVPVGNNALRAVCSRAAAIGKNRGRCHDFSDRTIKVPGPDGSTIIAPGCKAPVFPMLSPKLVHIQPDNRPVMEADIGTLARLKQGKYDPDVLKSTGVQYQWVHDIQFLLDQKPKIISIDTETTGLNTQAEDFRVIVVQISDRPGRTYLCRVTMDYFPDHPLFKDQTLEDVQRLRGQIKTLINDPSIKKVGHGFKYDFKALRTMGIETCGWDWDTELMARFVNENFLTYSLADLVKIYVPEMAGYSDAFDLVIDKSKMIEVPPVTIRNEKGEITTHGMDEYAGGDADATMRLAVALKPLLTSDQRNLHVLRSLHHRALVALTKTTETYGFGFDTEALAALDTELDTWIKQETRALKRMIPPAIRRKYLADPKGFSLTRPDCIRETLFKTQDAQGRWINGAGFNLTPVVFTDSTANDPDPSKRKASTSTKDHLPYHLDAHGTAGEFVTRYMELAKSQKMLDTYVRGFPRVLKKGASDSTVILPQYNFKTNTKRTQSVEPNGQNFPKRGRWAKHFRRLIRATKGKVLVASDLSQAELRIAAWMANEREMLRIYRENGDIHLETAAMVLGLTVAELMERGKAFYKPMRQNAKATNFGYIYGAFPKTYMQVAKTQYGVDVTLQEAERIREVYFARYADLPLWHQRMKAEAHENLAVRSLHGLTRHLPSILSPDWKIMSGAERNAVNSPVQNFGSDLGVLALMRLAAQADPNLIRPVGFIHDQLIAEVDVDYAMEGMGTLKWLMENPPLEEWYGITSPLPIISDPEWGLNLADSVELADADEATQNAVAPHIRKPDWWDDDEERAFGRYFSRADVPEYVLRDVTGASRQSVGVHV